MHTKIIDPKNSTNKAIYDNNSSSLRAVNYMNKENSDKEVGLFFNDESIGILHSEVVNSIDSNVKGLKANEAKFDSIVVSPSTEELKFIGNDPLKLMEYTRRVMKNYSDNFDLDAKPKLSKPVKFIDHGEAKYQFKEDASKSYFIKFLDSNNKERIIWGTDLKRAVDRALPNHGDMVHIDHLGMKEVSVPVNTKQPDGSWKEVLKTVNRNEWEIVSEQYRIDNPLKVAETIKKPSPNLVWYAVIHNSREYEIKDEKISNRIVDLKEQGYTKLDILQRAKSDLFLLKYKPSLRDIEYFYDNGAVKKGDLKPGENKHVHIIVSRRDKDMKITLNNSNRYKFDRRAYFSKNSKSFENIFGYKLQSKSLNEKREKMFGIRVDHINIKYNLAPGYLDKEGVLKIFRDPEFQDKFSKNFWKLENNFKKGVVVEDPESFLKYGSDSVYLLKDQSLSLTDLVGSFKSIGNAMGVEDEADLSSILKRTRNKKFNKSRNRDNSIKR